MVTNILMTTKARTNTYAKKKSGPNTLKKNLIHCNVVQLFSVANPDFFWLAHALKNRFLEISIKMLTCEIHIVH